MIFESKKHRIQTLRTLDLKRRYGEFEGFSIFQKIASGVNFGLIFESYLGQFGGQKSMKKHFKNQMQKKTGSRGFLEAPREPKRGGDPI